MRICISGCAGIGKSTLAQKLAEILAITLIDEHYRPFFHPPGTFKAPAQELVSTFHQVLANKSTLEDGADNFVVDRGGVDLLNLWMARRLNQLQPATEKFYDLCKSRVQRYDFVVFPPWGSIPLVPHETENDGRVRVQNPWVQLHNHATMLGLAHSWLPAAKIISIPVELSELEQRAAFVLHTLGSSQ